MSSYPNSSFNSKARFRWVQCQIEDLSRLHTDRDIRLALTRLPRDLNETYARILKSIREPDQEVASKALMWLAHGPRSLELSELAEAAIVEPGMISLDPEARWQPLDLIHVIGSLVIYSAENNRVSLAHHSVKEYLESTYVEKNVPIFYIPPRKASIEMAKTCLTYLLMKDFESGPTYNLDKYYVRISAYPLLHYAARFWPFHARSCLSQSQENLELACKLVHPSGHSNFRSWLEAMISPGYFDFSWLDKSPWPVTSSYPTRFMMLPQNLTPLYYAASFGLYEVVQDLLGRGVDINAQGGLYRGTALHAAIFRGHQDIMKLLLDSGAGIEIMDANGMTPVEMMIYYTRDDTIAEKFAPRLLGKMSKIGRDKSGYRAFLDSAGDPHQLIDYSHYSTFLSR